MIKRGLIDYARTLGIGKIGFAENSVVALFPYYVADEEGNLSLYARSIDYHIIATAKLKELASILVKYGASTVTIHVDNGEYDDRKAAFDAGLGFYGQNGMLISEGYGSYFFIGQIIHDLKIEPDSPLDMECLMCGRCERQCPGKALMGGNVNIEKCLSHITQKRGDLTKDETQLIKNYGLCWGCDICQRVCPHNQGLETTAISEFLKGRITSLDLSDIECLSNREFKDRYGKYAFSWRGKSVLQRNLQILFSEELQNEEK